MKKIVKWLWIAPVLAALYAGVTIWMRQAETSRIEAEAQQQQAKKDLDALERLGGGSLKVLTFYANPPAIARGARGLLCYGVAAADAVAIAPEVGSVSNSLSRCVEVTPKATTEYVLTARKGGEEQQAKAVVQVR